MTTLYVKRGRRYYPAAEHEEIDSYPQGAHLVICEPGSTMRRFGINPDEAALLAAAEPLRKEIARIVSDGMAMRPSRKPITDRQRAAWAALVNAMGSDGYIIEYASVQETADSVVRMLIDRARGAWRKYLPDMLCRTCGHHLEEVTTRPQHCPICDSIDLTGDDD